MSTFEQVVKGVPEVAASLATGISAFVASGYAGLAAPIFGNNPEEIQNEVLRMFTYAPRQKAAQNVMEIAGRAMHLFKMAGL